MEEKEKKRLDELAEIEKKKALEKKKKEKEDLEKLEKKRI